MSNTNERVWEPQNPEKSRLFDFLKRMEQRSHRTFENYQALHQWSIDEPACFWGELASYFNLHFATPPKQIVNAYNHPLDAKWFEGATLNFAEHLLADKSDRLAIISIDEKNHRETLTFKQLRTQVASVAKGLKNLGVEAGSRVAAVMPNCAATIIAMLATTSLGAIWSSCSPDFGEKTILDRLGQIDPLVLIICDGHQYAGKSWDDLSKIVKLTQAIPSLAKTIIYPWLNPQARVDLADNYMCWHDLFNCAAEPVFQAFPFDHPLYILFSSGTTGKPKCIVHGAGNTLLQHLKELALHTDLRSSDNLFFFTTCGWMMWNWMVSALALGTPLTLYDGSPLFPDASRLFQIIEEESVSVFGTSAQFISTVEKEGISPAKAFSMPALRCLLSTGSPLLPHQYDFIQTQIKPDIQIASISGGTDIVSCFALGNPLLPVYRGELQSLGLGLAVKVFNEKGQAVTGEKGELVCTRAFPSMPVAFWKDPEKKAYYAAYFNQFEGVWAHHDFAEITAHQGLIIHGRSDTTLNPQGVRIGTAEIYRQIEELPEILDAIVIGQNWEDDVRVILFVKLREGIVLDEDLKSKIKATLRHNASPRHVPAKIIQVPDIPHTVNGKLVELAVKQIVQGEKISNPESIANPESLSYFKDHPDLTR